MALIGKKIPPSINPDMCNQIIPLVNPPPTLYCPPPAELSVLLFLLMLIQLLLQVQNLKMGRSVCMSVGDLIKVFFAGC